MYQLLSDTACDLSAAEMRVNHIDFVPFHYQLDGTDYADDLERGKMLENFYSEIKAGTMPTTSQVNVGSYVDFFTPYVEKGIAVLYLGFSSGLSGSFASAEQAKELVLESHPDADIRLVDTFAASAGEGKLLLEAAARQQQGMSIDELEAWVKANQIRLQSWFTVDSLDFLYHGGRVSRTAATIGTLLSVKPVMDVSNDGKLQVVTKVRGRKRALLMLADKIVAAMAGDEKQHVLVATSGDYDAAEVVKAAIGAKIPGANVTVGPIGPTIASHTGFGCVAVFAMGQGPRHPVSE